MLINPRDKKCENMNSLIDLGLGLFDAKNKDSVLTVNAESPCCNYYNQAYYKSSRPDLFKEKVF